MRIITKRQQLTTEQIQELVHRGLDSRAEVADCREYTDGAFSAVHAVTLTDGREHLYLITVTEDATRGFDPAYHEPIRRRTLDLLNTELTALARQ